MKALFNRRVMAAFFLFMAFGLPACSGGGGGDGGGGGGSSDTTPPVVTASPAGGSYGAGQLVSLSANESATIYYTTNGSTPTTSSSVYSTAISIGTSTTLKFMAVDAAGNASAVSTESYTIASDTLAPTVSASPGGGSYDSVQFVALSANEPATIYYTSNGSTPSTSSSVYSGPLTISATTTLKFFARDTAGNSSSVSSATYTIDTSSPTVAANPLGGTLKGTQFVTLVPNKSATIYYTLDGTTPTVSSRVYYSPIRINPSSTTTLKYFARDRLGNLGTVATQTYNTGAAITGVTIQNTGGAQTNVPVTFGQVFAAGDVPASFSLVGKLENDSDIPLQVDAKATHADGSLRHAVISLVLPSLGAGETATVYLHKGSPGSTTPVSPASLVSSGFSASVNVKVGGIDYTASPVSALNSSDYSQWLQGPIANEWIAKVPLIDASSVAHPHLTARFAIRAYPGSNKAKVDVVVENNWAYEPAPQNFTYSVDVLVGGAGVYSNASLTHYHHARWRKTFWWNGEPAIHVKHDPKYLVESGALPHYDSSIAISSSALSSLATSWSSANKAPMGNGLILPYFPTTGGRGDIGPLPSWASIYLLSMNETAKIATLGVGDLAGSFPIHYRDKLTDLPVSLIDHPKMTISGSASDAGTDVFPSCGSGGCSTPYTVDDAHQPSLAYVPYIVTGDYYFLEELQFWANYNMLKFNPNYRQFEKGLLLNAQIRGQAWSLRTLAQVAYITPDAHAFKAYFVDRVNHNINFYHSSYITGTPKNTLGYLDNTGSTVAFNPFVYAVNLSTVGNGIGLATWQDDFFTWAVGHLVDLGFSNAQPFFDWKAQFPIGRMTSAGWCWIDGVPYSFVGRATNSSPPFSSFSEAYAATMTSSDGTPLSLAGGALYTDQPCGSQAAADWRTQYDTEKGNTRAPWLAGEMTGFSDSTTGFPSNMQPALAAAARTSVTNAKTAWDVFINRSVKPNYGDSPQWAVVPWNQ